MPSSLTPPQLPPTWHHSAQDIEPLIIEALEKDKKVSDRVVALTEDKLSFENVFLALANAETELKLVVDPLSLYKDVSTSKEIRDASTKAAELYNKYSIEELMREDLYAVKVAAEANLRKTGAWEKLNSEQKRLVEKMILDGKRAGLALGKEDREKLKTLKTELSNACLKFSQNYNEENGHITLTRQELDGVPEDVISGYTQCTEGDEVFYKVTFKSPDIFPVFGSAHNVETRRTARKAFDERLTVNLEVMNTVFRLRKQIAELLGYNSWADYITEVHMVKSSAGVRAFLESLHEYLKPLGKRDLEDLIALKKEDYSKRSLPIDENLYHWDSNYYNKLYVHRNLDLDSSLVKEYFPVSFVVPAMLDIYQNLLGVQFVEITGDAKDVWHPDVQQYAIWEKDAKDESDFVGYCYLDLYPRDHKYSHNSVYCLSPGFELPSGKRHYPATCIVANVAKPTPEYPALMQHFDVTNFLFHELGHIFHELLSRTQYARFHGPNVALGFGEAPSQMLENWCWEPEVLKKMTSHYQTQEPMPDELIAKLIQSRYVHVGLFYLRQLAFATYDLVVHDNSLDENTDYTKLWNKLRQDMMGLKGGEEPGQTAFQHLISGSGVGYYGYTYSLVFATDLYTTVFKKGPLDPERGRFYRDKILLPGGSRDEMDILRDFLGREPNPKAFIDQLERAGVLAA